MFADEITYWIGVNKNLIFKTSNISTTVAFPTSTLAGAAGGQIKLTVKTTDSSTGVTLAIPFFVIASS
jgi:hypothetical protein